MSVIQAYKEVGRDASFYNDSGGGITISGGEPMMQPEFVYALLRYCKENWIDTAIETSGSGIVGGLFGDPALSGCAFHRFEKH